MTPDQILQKIHEEVQNCKNCGLHFSRKHAVSGIGPANAKVMFIGEGPGFHENETGIPFVGGSGRFLDELLNRIRMKREDVFIGNVVKCRPPGNRDPLHEELIACNPYLDRQINAIHPAVIVTLGRFSMAKFLPKAKVSEVHGKAFKIRGRLVVPMYHPAAALHQPSLRPILEEDFDKLPGLITQAGEIEEFVEEADNDQASPEQLSMF